MNQDGSMNGPGNAAPGGSAITLYATGEGQTSPAGVDGKLGTTPLPRPVAAVTVTIGGLTAPVQSAGGVPGMVAGVMQVSVLVPGGLTGNVPVIVTVGGANSQAGVTLAVR
jgi:uncharacterized protein (TIGR03437 family)